MVIFIKKKKRPTYRSILIDHLELINQIESKNKIIWLDAGGGHRISFKKKYHYLLKNVRLISIDLDKKALQKNKIATKKIIANLEKIPLKSNSIDLITLDYVIEHLKNPIRVIKELSRVLKKNGEIIIRTPNSNNYYPFIARNFPNWYKYKYKREKFNVDLEDVYPHYYKMNKRSILKRYLRKEKIIEKEFYYIPGHFFPKKMFIIYYIEKIIILILFLLRIKIFDINLVGRYKKKS